MKLIILLFSCLHISNALSALSLTIVEKISCYGDNLTLSFPNESNETCGINIGRASIFIDAKEYVNNVSRKYAVQQASPDCIVIIRSLNEIDMIKTTRIDVGFDRSPNRSLTYSEVFGNIQGKPCNKFDRNNCSLCNPSTRDYDNGTYKNIFSCRLELGAIPEELRCNGVSDCTDGSDEGLNCSADTDTDTDTGAYVASATSLIVGVVYVALLVKHKNIKTKYGLILWLLSPFTEHVKFLFRHSDYKQSTTNMNN